MTYPGCSILHPKPIIRLSAHPHFRKNSHVAVGGERWRRHTRQGAGRQDERHRRARGDGTRIDVHRGIRVRHPARGEGVHHVARRLRPHGRGRAGGGGRGRADVYLRTRGLLIGHRDGTGGGGPADHRAVRSGVIDEMMIMMMRGGGFLWSLSNASSVFWGWLKY